MGGGTRPYHRGQEKRNKKKACATETKEIQRPLRRREGEGDQILDPIKELTTKMKSHS